MNINTRRRTGMLRSGWLAVGVVCALGLAAAGCKERAKGSAATSTDWSTITAAQEVEAMTGLCLLSRHVDLSSKGSPGQVTLAFSAKGIEVPGGENVAIGPGLWKGMVKMAQTNNGGAAARALPAKAHSYGDGLGPARRHAYTVSSPDAETLIFTLVKALGDESAG
ncbi:MAG: hypothetical protein ACT4PL_12715 [Phycisphaerales bacterium]